MEKKKYLFAILSLLVGAFILGHLTIYNHFPLVLGDSLGYIERGFKHEINHHWALAYSLFLKIFSFDKSLLVAIFFQNIWICIIIRLFISKFILIKYENLLFLLIITLLSIMSYLPQVSNLLMADIFTSLGLVSIILFVYFVNRFIVNIFLFITMSFSVISHGSHGPIYILFLLLILCFSLTAFLLYKTIDLRNILKKVIICFSVFAFASFLLKPLVNSFFSELNPDHAPTVSNSVSESRYHFIWFQLQKTVIYEDFLSEYCPQKKYKYLCNPEKMDFIKKKGKNWLLHGPDVSWLKEIEDAGKTALFDFKYISFLVRERLYRVVLLFKNNKFRNSYALVGIEKKIKKILPIDSRIIKKSPSYNKRLYTKSQRDFLCKWNTVILKIAAAFLLFFLFYIFKKKIMNNCYLAIYTLVLAHLSNVALMGLFANIHNSRYVYRTSWLLILGVILLFVTLYTQKTTQKLN